jgi:hypothetical protein
MKKSILKTVSVFLVLLFALGIFAACEKKEIDDRFAIKADGVTVILGAEADSAIEALGTPLSSEPTGNCGGLRETFRYDYPTFFMSIVDYEDGDKIIDTIELKNDGAETSKGIYIGSSEADVRAKYGEPDKSEGRQIVYETEDKRLIIGITDGAVSSIVLKCK